MDHKGHFRSRDGFDLYERRWMPDADVRANVVLLHGYGEHCSRYEHVARMLNEAGISVLTYDQRGFGHSPGKRGYIRDFDLLLHDFDAYIEHIHPRLEGKSWFIMGHSMGGLVLARYAETRIVKAVGLVFSTPFLGFNDDVPKFLFPIASVLGVLAPWIPVGSVDTSKLSRDPAVVESAEKDPFEYHGKVLARTGAQLNAAVTQACANFEAITQPAYIIHGTDDGLVPPSGSQALHDGCRSEDKTLTLYEGGYHELWNDLDKETVISGIRDWILCRI